MLLVASKPGDCTFDLPAVQYPIRVGREAGNHRELELLIQIPGPPFVPEIVHQNGKRALFRVEDYAGRPESFVSESCGAHQFLPCGSDSLVTRDLFTRHNSEELQPFQERKESIIRLVSARFLAQTLDLGQGPFLDRKVRIQIHLRCLNRLVS